MATRFKIKVSPKSSGSAIVGWEGEELKVRVAAVPEKGKANKELLKVLSKHLRVPSSRLRLVGGERSRHKVVEVAEMAEEELLERLPPKP